MFAPLEARNILAFRKLDHERIVTAAVVVVLLQLEPQPAGEHPDQRIPARVVGFRFVQNYSANYVFLEAVGVPLERLVDRKSQQTAQTFGSRKLFTRQDPIDFVLYGLWGEVDGRGRRVVTFHRKLRYVRFGERASVTGFFAVNFTFFSGVGRRSAKPDGLRHWKPLNTAKQEQDHENQNHRAQCTARIIPPGSAVGPRWKRAQQQNHQDHQQ